MWEPGGAKETLIYTEVATFGLGLEWISWVLTSKERTRAVLSRGDSMSESMDI